MATKRNDIKLAEILNGELIEQDAIRTYVRIETKDNVFEFGFEKDKFTDMVISKKIWEVVFEQRIMTVNKLELV